MKSVILGEGLTHISNEDTKILNNDRTVTRVYIHKDVQAIAPYAFRGRVHVKEIIFQKGSQCRTIGQSAFLYCLSLNKITLPFSLKQIGIRAFQYCISLESVSIPPLVDNLSELSFSYCPLLTSLFILGKDIRIDPNALVGTRITSCTIWDQKFAATQIHERLVLYKNSKIVNERKVVYGTMIYGIQNREYYGKKYFVVWNTKSEFDRYAFTGYGTRLKEAMKDLDFIEIQQDIPDRLKNLSEEDWITKEDYQILTRDCKYGVEQFLFMNNITQDKMQVKDIIALTKNEKRGRPELLQRFIEEVKEKNNKSKSPIDKIEP